MSVRQIQTIDNHECTTFNFLCFQNNPRYAGHNKMFTMHQIQSCADCLIKYDGIVYRSCSPQYAKEQDLLTGEGSRLAGGRWNPSGIAAVYSSLTPETAMAETLAHFRYFHLPIHLAMPRMFLAVHVLLQKVLDLTNGQIRQRLQFSEKNMIEEDWRKTSSESAGARTQIFGKTIHDAGFEGLLVRSAADLEGMNLIIFPGNLLAGSHIEAVNRLRLD